MAGRRLRGGCVALVLLPLVCGCLTGFRFHDTVRAKEKRRPIGFENEQAGTLFQTAVAHRFAEIDETTHLWLGIPFITLLQCSSKISESAYYNDQLAVCDTNGDHMISLSEAAVYHQTSFPPSPAAPVTQPPSEEP